jgi:hypothetical protein
MSVNIDQLNNVVSGYDNTSRNSYNLFSFIDDTQNEYNNSAIFEREISDMFTNFRPYILSEESNSCLISNQDRLNYDTKLNNLISILNTCKNPNITNKDECMYNEFIKPDTIQSIKDLTTIISKINNECMFKNVSTSDKTNVCNSNQSEILNNFSNDKINKNLDFINKYSSIIVQLKTIADNNLKNYLNTCNQNPERLESYNNVQNLLAKALFESKICPSSTSNCPAPTPVTKETCLANPDISANINELQVKNVSLSKEKNDIETEYTKFKDDADSFTWDSNLSVRNGWIYFGVIIVLIIIIVVLAYMSFGRPSRDEYERNAYRPY